MQALPFRPPLKGFDESFNTFRLGKAWAKRVSVGDTVALQNTKTKTIFGYATVTQIFQGDREHMAQQHASYGHNFIASDLPAAQHPEAMLKRLKNAYGTRAFKNMTEVTVIYLQREQEDEQRGLDYRGLPPQG